MAAVETALIVGADGQIGQALATELRVADEIVRTTTRRRPVERRGEVFLDLAAEPDNWALPEAVTVAYLCAAVTSQEACRQNPAASAQVNVRRTVTLAGRLAAAGAFVVFLSSSLVYDGQKPYRLADEAVCPQTEYGRQKAEAEARLSEALGNALAVVRLTKIVGPRWPLLRQWQEALEHRQVIYPFADLVMAPVSLGRVVRILRQIGGQRLSGTWQVSADRDISYLQAAHYLAQRLDAPPELVQATTSVQRGISLESIPAYTALDTGRLQAELGIRPPAPWQALDEALVAVHGKPD